jgi:hypothetical protein
MYTPFRAMVAAVASFAIGTCLSQTKSEQPLSGFRISGRVVDQSVTPIAGQVVNFRIVDSGSPDVVKTGADGRFSFLGHADEPYELYIASKRIGTVLITDGRNLDLGDVALELPGRGGTAARITGPVRMTSTPRSASLSLPGAKIAALYISCSANSTEWCGRSVMHIITDDGREVLPPLERDQVGCNSPQLSEDRLEAGWLVESENCCTSYPISTALVVFRLGKGTRRFGTGMPIFGWGFVAQGKQVTFHTDVLHGTSVPYDELRDIETGQLVRQAGRRGHE